MEMMKMSNPFVYIDNISSSRESIWEDSISDKEYNPYMVNRGLSQYRDTVLFAQVMNMNGQFVSPKMQYDFYRHAITSKKKRFAKWHKPDKLEEIEKLARHFGINIRDMENYVSLMSETDYEQLMRTLEKGGRNGTKQR
jgi:hypothetical protein